MVTRTDTSLPTLDQSVVIPVEPIPQEFLTTYSRAHQTPRVSAKKFIEDVQLPGYNTKMAKASDTPSTPSDDSKKDPTYIP